MNPCFNTTCYIIPIVLLMPHQNSVYQLGRNRYCITVACSDCLRARGKKKGTAAACGGAAVCRKLPCIYRETGAGDYTSANTGNWSNWYLTGTWRLTHFLACKAGYMALHHIFVTGRSAYVLLQGVVLKQSRTKHLWETTGDGMM